MEIDQLAPGDRLSSSRELIDRYGISPATVSRAIARLAAEGAVVTRPGSGTFVAPRRTAPHDGVADTSWQSVTLAGRDTGPVPAGRLLDEPHRDAITMAGGYLHRSLRPDSALVAAMRRAAGRPDAWDRAPTAGLASLRAVFARLAGGAVTPEDVLVTSGGQSALSIVFRAIIPPGSPVLMESPTYPGALAAARAAGLRPVPVPMDADGVRLELLAEAFARTGARLLYCQPALHNPTGAVLAADRRRQLIDVARAVDAFVVEDDFARLLGHGGTPPPALVADDHEGTVIYLTSLTKPAAPSLRIGALIARGPVMARLRAIRHVDDFFVARPLQEAAVELLSTPAWERHQSSLANALRERCATLAAELTRRLPDWSTRLPNAGLHLWVSLPAALGNPSELADAARTRGVVVSSGDDFYPAEPQGPYLRLSFAAAELTDLAEGVRRLSAAAHDLAHRG
ncbi:PLP-dependent aminotransferase family protein [Actinomadura fulvescens]|uniref:PLP-dependent aminotransferase family protein n=2 Tax=Actinomadura fulvescens TaxID=46160 RepID=A0ABP6BWQ3_9ACTN